MKGVGKSIIFPDNPARAPLHGAVAFTALWSRSSTCSEGSCRDGTAAGATQRLERAHIPREREKGAGTAQEKGCWASMGRSVRQTLRRCRWLRVKPGVAQPEPALLHKGMGSSPAWAGWKKRIQLQDEGHGEGMDTFGLEQIPGRL